MRRIVGLLLLLLAIGWLFSELPTGMFGDEVNVSTAWRRTRDGWQRHCTLVVGHPAPPPQLHPGIVASFEGLLSLAGMIAFSKSWMAGGRR